MKICLLSIYSGATDGSFQKFAFHLNQELSQRHEVLHLNLQNILSPRFWKELRGFRPQIIHYTPGPTLKSFILAKFLAFYCHKAKTVITALQPGYSSLSRIFIPFFKPDVVLVQSLRTERVLSDLGCKTQWLLGGVDTAKFIPVSPKAKSSLRQKYQLDKKKFTILTVAPVVKQRGLEMLGKIAKEGDIQVVIVGSTATKVDHQLLQSLQANGCIVWPSYFTSIEEVYMLSDCYVFTSSPSCRHRMELPLSILEAMSCNLPVITTKFGVFALPNIFPEGDGLFFIESEEELSSRLNTIRNSVEVNTREKVLPYSWDKLAEELERIYAQI